MAKKIIKSPASGDRIDFGGKVPQFELFADKVYRELTRRNLVWIKVGDAEAGNADDIQYATRTEIHAYQVKWTQQLEKPSFRYLEFIALFPKLRESWLSITKSNEVSCLPVYVYLTTNRPPNDNSKLGSPTYDGIGSFANFISKILPVIQSGEKLPADWERFLNEETRKLNLTVKEFIDFAKYLRVEFNAILPQPINDRHHDIYQQDVNNLYKFFHDDLAKKEGQVRFTANEIIKELHWEGRVKTNFSHDFYVDPKTYQPNVSTLESLSTAIDLLPGGYIFLKGGPGSGKSSLLTQWASSRVEKVIKYFAYLNQTNGNLPVRGEAMNLFHDLSIQLTETGIFGSTIFGLQRDLTQTRQAFQNQLQQLGKLYKEHHSKTLIIIDGLDHIPREYAKQGTFLRHLPDPSDIPDGVYIILGSQSFELEDLAITVSQVAEQADRKIAVEPLLPDAVSKIVDNVLDEPLNLTQHDALFKASGGHPLYLQYVLRTILNDDGSFTIEEKLANLLPFDGDIALYYDRIWREFETDENIADLLGLVSRLRFGFHLDMSAEWQIARHVARKAKRWFDQFFDDSFGFKVFFHNSFRQFLLTKTAEDPWSGNYQIKTNINYHIRLADWSGTSSIRLFRHEHLHHVHQAGQTERFHDTLTPDYVDQQRHAFRPFDSIREDLLVGLQLAAEVQNLSLVLRYGFLMGELSQRSWNLDESLFLSYFPKLFDFESVIAYALLPINSFQRRSWAFKLARILYQNNYEADARRLFYLAEPTAYSKENLVIDGDDGFHWEEQVRQMEEWIKAKCMWADPMDLLESAIKVDVVREGNDFMEEERQKRIQELQTKLLDALIESLSDTPSHRKHLLAVFSRFDYSRTANAHFFLPLLHRVIDICLNNDETSLAKTLLDIFTKKLNLSELTNNQRIEIAWLEFTIDVGSTSYKSWLDDVIPIPITEIPFDAIINGNSLDFYLPYYWYFTLLIIQGKTFDVADFFPDASDESDATEWFKMMARLARIHGEGLRGDKFQIAYLSPIIRLYYQPTPSPTNYKKSSTSGLKKKYYLQVVKAVATYGKEALSETATLFVDEISRNPSYWPYELQFDIWLAYDTYGLDRLRVKQLIDKLTGATINEQHDLNSRMEKAMEFSEAYLDLEFPEIAQNWLLKATDESLGIGYRKDFQLNSWIRWLRKVNILEPDQAESRISSLVAHLDHLNKTTEAASNRAADDLLECCMDWNPAAGLELFDWLLKRKYADIDDGISVLLDKVLGDKASPSLLVSSADLFGKVLLFSSKYFSKKTFSILIKVLSQNKQDYVLAELVEDVERYALAELRPEYRELLASANIPFTASKDFPMEERERNRKGVNTIRVSNDTQLTQSEFIEKYDSADEFQKLVSRGYDTSSDFDWSVCLGKIEHELSESWLIDTASGIARNERSTFWLLLALGEMSHAKDFGGASKSISKNLLYVDDTTWSVFYDGGKRLRAFEFAIKVEGEPARQDAWYDFVKKLERGSTIELFRELDHILPVLAPDANICLIWKEVELYLKRVFTHAKKSDDIPNLSSILPENDPESLLARLALNLSLIAEQGLRETALVHVAKQTANENTSYAKELRRFVKNTDSDIDLEIFAKVAIHLNEVSPQILSEFVEELKKLSDSCLFSTILTANTLLERIGVDTQPKTLVQLSLNWLSNSAVEISQEQELRKFNEAISRGWTGSRFSTEHLYNLLTHYLDNVATMTGFDNTVLFQRTIDLLSDELNHGNGRLLKLAQGNEIGLETTYHPHKVIIPFLIDRLLNELWLAGYIASLESVDWINPLFDSASLKFIQHRRPENLPGVRGFDDYYMLASDWVEHAEDGFSHFTKQIDKQIVIAERTLFRGLGWELDTEMRESCLAVDSGGTSHEFRTGAFSRKMNLSVKDYEIMGKLKNSIAPTSLLIIANHIERFLDTPNHLSEWVAINPTVAILMGWKLSDPYKFQWVDLDGNIMIESFFWIDGNVRMQPPQLKSQAGCGWIVTASPEAFEALNKQYKLIHKFFINRYTRNKSTQEHTDRTLHHIENIAS